MQKISIGATIYHIASYGISPENSCKRVIYNIDPGTTPEMLLKRIEPPGYEALTCRRLGNTTTMVITFLGKRVPYYIEFSGLLLRCYLYKRTVPHCRTCNETGNRENATLKAEITNVLAEFVAHKDELLEINCTTPTQNTSTRPPEKRKREEQPAQTVTSSPTLHQAITQPTTPQGVIPVQYATPQKVEEIVAKAIHSLHISLQATMQ
ncbi:hypothetical protein HPB49_009624 [Dermacentor silvarum]|uniref:Uncharacterized protein n=1 Tax=Dermacentor silvarum TaxID=543639 RepID=A0ACB8D4G5_DERSI|nr:hypothetical protein HPB49_009624 [Dermacentor silvarum]